MPHAKFALSATLFMVVFVGFYVACWWVPHIGHRIFGRLGLIFGGAAMMVLPLVFVVVSIQVWTGMNECARAEVEKGIWTDNCDSAADVFVFFTGLILAPLALLVTGLTTQRRWKFSSWQYPLEPKMSHEL